MGTVAAVIILAVQLPFKLLAYLLKNKALLIIAIIIIAIFVVPKIINSNTGAASVAPVQNYQKNPPPPEYASQVVQTPSRFYYVADLTDNDKTITLNRFYSYDRKDWKLNTLPLPLNKADVKIYDRGGTK